jgi:hypothetical protein
VILNVSRTKAESRTPMSTRGNLSNFFIVYQRATGSTLPCMSMRASAASDAISGAMSRLHAQNAHTGLPSVSKRISHTLHPHIHHPSRESIHHLSGYIVACLGSELSFSYGLYGSYTQFPPFCF